MQPVTGLHDMILHDMIYIQGPMCAPLTVGTKTTTISDYDCGDEGDCCCDGHGDEDDIDAGGGNYCDDCDEDSDDYDYDTTTKPLFARRTAQVDNTMHTGRTDREAVSTARRQARA